MFTRIRSSSNAWIEVALPSSVCRRQTKPGLSSAIALIGSSISTKPASGGESIGALNLAMLICASCHPVSVTGRVYPATMERSGPAASPPGRTGRGSTERVRELRDDPRRQHVGHVQDLGLHLVVRGDAA